MTTKKDPAAVALGRRGGKVRSAAKAATARENGKRGGRPPVLPIAERLARIRARIDAGKSITPNEAALHYVTLHRNVAKALAWTRQRQQHNADNAGVRIWWDAVVACIERGVE